MRIVATKMATEHDIVCLEESGETTNASTEAAVHRGGGLVLVAKKNTVSPVWTHFGLNRLKPHHVNVLTFLSKNLK